MRHYKKTTFLLFIRIIIFIFHAYHHFVAWFVLFTYSKYWVHHVDWMCQSVSIREMKDMKLSIRIFFGFFPLEKLKNLKSMLSLSGWVLLLVNDFHIAFNFLPALDSRNRFLSIFDSIPIGRHTFQSKNSTILFSLILLSSVLINHSVIECVEY